MNIPIRLCAAGLVAALLLGPPALAQGPGLNIPRSAAETGLTNEQREQVDTYIAALTKALAAADNAKRVVEIRTLLIRGYNQHGTAAAFQDAYAGSMAVHGKSLLSGQFGPDDPLTSLREINLAISVGRMAQGSLLPLAEAMVLHKNPAVRYFGWNAYALLRAPLMAAGGDDLQAMYATIAKAASQETDPLVLAELMRTLHLPPSPTPGQGVTSEAHQDAQGKFFGILKADWAQLCQRVLAVDGAMSETAAGGVNTARSLAIGLGDQAVRKAAMQMALNMAWSAGKAFDRSLQMMRAAEAAKNAQAGGEGAADVPAGAEAPEAGAAEKAGQLAQALGTTPEALAAMSDDIEQAVSANALLLKECEEALNVLTGKGEPGERHIRKPLSAAGSMGDPGAAVQLGVLKWVDELRKTQGLMHPKDVVPAKPATAPATKPATAPATVPASKAAPPAGPSIKTARPPVGGSA
jgi:hypothetical protein